MIEEYIKAQLTAQNIPMKDAAEVLGYNKNSFYNKLSRHSLNLHDLIMLSLILEEKIMFTDADDKPLYIFNYTEYINDEDMARLKAYQDNRANKLNFSSWFDSLPDNQKKFLFNGINRTKEEMLQLMAKKRSEGCISIESTNFTHVITVCGVNCQDAADWLSEKTKNMSPEDEIMSCVACEKFFDVYISYESPTPLEIS